MPAVAAGVPGPRQRLHLFLTGAEAVLSLRQPAAGPDGPPGPSGAGYVLRLRLVGANPAPVAEGQERQASTSNYLIGNDPTQWHTGVANYGQVADRGVYPGVDLLYYGRQRQLEYDFVVAPGADPGVIRLGIEGAQGLAVDAQGNLVVHAAG